MTTCVVTRAQPGAVATADALAGYGHRPIVIPAAIITPTHARVERDGVQALLMTSAAAARHAKVHEGLRDLPVYAVGDATAQAAIDAGFTTVISAGGDGAALAVLAADRMKPSDGTLLHLRGSEVAGDVTGMLETCGFQTRFVEVYQTRDHPDFARKLLDTIENQEGIIIVHSPAGTRRVMTALYNCDAAFPRWSVVGLSPACLVDLQDKGFKALFSAPSPDENALMATIAAL
jgi:uroporphyrinogen-III synthase